MAWRPCGNSPDECACFYYRDDGADGRTPPCRFEVIVKNHLGFRYVADRDTGRVARIPVEYLMPEYAIDEDECWRLMIDRWDPPIDSGA